MALPENRHASEYRPDPVAIILGGSEIRYERLWTVRDDWRMTAFGPINFGQTTVGPPRRVRGSPPAC